MSVQPHKIPAQQAVSNDKLYRYPGPHSFQDRDVERDSFYGRKDEIRDLVNKILSYRLIVLFGKSGLGKTSLLQAGAYLQLRHNDLLPIPIRVNQRDATLMDIVLEAVLKITEDKNNRIDYTPGNTEGLWEFFKTAVFWKDGVLQSPVLVFDQFEEIFTLQTPAGRKAISEQLGDLVSSGLPQRIREQFILHRQDKSQPVTFSEKPPELKLVISLREDYVGALQELFPEVPTILSNRVRLTAMTEKQAHDAVIKPAQLKDDHFHTQPFNYAPDTVKLLFSYLGRSGGDIEPFQLQVLCQHMERQVEREQRKQQQPQLVEVTPDYLGDENKIDAIMANLYRSSINQLPAGKRRRECKRLCEFGLLTGDGHRETLGELSILENYQLQLADLNKLVDLRILRREPRRNSSVYELSHDSLAKPVMHQRPTRIPKWLKFTAAFTLILLLAFGYYADFQRKQAEAIDKIKLSTQDAAQKQIEPLLKNNSQLQKQNESLAQNLEALRKEAQKASENSAKLNAENEALSNRLAEFQQQAELAVDQTARQVRLENQKQLDQLQQSIAKLQQQLQQNSAQQTQQTRSVLEPELVEIPAGKFLMGSSKKDDLAQANEFPQHSVKIRPFMIGKYEVTFDEYDAFALATKREPPNDEGWGRGQRPVINVSWRDAVAYARWLSEQTGLKYRLPSEAEWEYAARAGSTGIRYWSDKKHREQEPACLYANVLDEKSKPQVIKKYSGASDWKYFKCGDNNPFTAPVGQFEPNDWKLQDMLGNVWEWVQDCYVPTYEGAPEDGSTRSESKCESRVLRGGSWLGEPVVVRSATRGWSSPGDRNNFIGFRLARTL